MSKHLMIDLETLDVTPTATILSIGAQGFDPFSDKLTDVTFYKRITLESQDGRSINESTVEWWSQQSPEAQEEAFGEENRIHIKDALIDLSKAAWNHDKIWANGITFDISILENAMRQYGVPVPWKYYNVMDARTLFKIYPSIGSANNNHNALADCINQIDMVQKVIRELGLKF